LSERSSGCAPIPPPTAADPKVSDRPPVAAGTTFPEVTVRAHPSLLLLVLSPLLVLAGCGEQPTAPGDPSPDPGSLDSRAGPSAGLAAHSAGRISGGGKIREENWQVSFAGHADRDPAGNLRGVWRITFDEVSVPEIRGGAFVAKEFLGLRLVPPPEPETYVGRANLLMGGTFDGEPGWTCRVLATDGAPEGTDAFDSFRVVLYDPAGDGAYDSSTAGTVGPGREFPAVSAARTEIDVGGVRIWMPG
jgi:hypothetical protein